jgi:hypothetical protein
MGFVALSADDEAPLSGDCRVTNPAEQTSCSQGEGTSRAASQQFMSPPLLSAWRRLDRYTLQCAAASGQNGGARDPLKVENLIRFALRHDAGLRNQLVRGVTEDEVTATALDVLNTGDRC